MTSFFDGLITSKTRIKLLIRLFLNPESRSYLRELAGEFNVSSNAVREELNQLAHSNLLVSEKVGRQVHYRANRKHPLFPELTSMVRKTIGVDKVIDWIVGSLGKLEQAYLIGDYAEGRDNGIIDLLLVGDINFNQLHKLSKKTEQYINRKIRHLVLTREEFDRQKETFLSKPHLLIWRACIMP